MLPSRSRSHGSRDAEAWPAWSRALTWPQVAAANTVAALVMGAYLWRVHREMVSQLVQEMEEQRAT